MKIREMLDRLDEISRRDFLKGVGATAGLAATGGAGSALGQTANAQQNTAATAAEKARLDQLARLKAASGMEFQIQKKVYPLIAYDVRKLPPQENPAVVVQINPGPNGLIEKISVVKPSPYPDWDKAVVTAIQRAETLPSDASGKFPEQPINVMFKPKSSWSTPNEQGVMGYADRVRRKIKPLIVFNANETEGNPAVVVLVDLAPDGMMLKKTIVSPSTDPKWDQAIMTALDRAESLPRDADGKIPMRQIKLTFKPKD
jgi:TonB family protein